MSKNKDLRILVGGIILLPLLMFVMASISEAKTKGDEQK
jgi:hypothetical protein